MKKFGTWRMQVQFLDDPIDADGQLRRWRVDRVGLIEAVRYAHSFYVECTANDPLGFEHIISYGFRKITSGNCIDACAAPERSRNPRREAINRISYHTEKQVASSATPMSVLMDG